MTSRKNPLWFLWAPSLLSLTLLAESSLPKTEAMTQVFPVLMVSKNEFKADLLTLPPDGELPMLIKSYPIATGRVPGDKMVEGDQRTPSGVFFPRAHVDPSILPPEKYGPYAVPFDYPNLMDRYDKRTGTNIWLHGAGDDKRLDVKQVTDGCVVVQNNQIKELGDWLKPHQSVVVIADSTAEVNRPEDVKELSQRAASWLTAWREKNATAYMQHYATEFTHQGRDWGAFNKYKSSLFRHYRNISIDVSFIRSIVHPKYGVTFMNQEFWGDRTYHSVGRKILYWVKQEGSWKILRESFDRQLFQTQEVNLANNLTTFRQ